jgi:glycosyltransferase involved in cell wall biosynthesis
LRPLISIVITNYNYANFIGEAIRSAIDQDYFNKEIIVVDDGSTDNSIEVIGRYIDHIGLIQQKNGGVSSARNAGVAKSIGEYVAFLDADDYWMTTKISEQYESLVNSEADLSYCKMQIVKPDGSYTLSEECRQGNFEKMFPSFPGQTPFPPSSVLVARNLITSVGDWDTELLNSAEDFDYFRRCSLKSKFVFVDNILVVHREHSKSLTSGPVGKYFKYNLSAMVKMYADSNVKVSYFAKRLGTFRFYLSLAKTYFKKLDVFKGLVMLMLTILPMNSGKIVSRRFSKEESHK